MKKETKGSKFMHEEILNDFDGLFNYITAANIREKVINII
jgi:hypothetical protein